MPVGDLELVEDKFTVVLGLSLYVTTVSLRSLFIPSPRSGCVVYEPPGPKKEERLLGRDRMWCRAEW